MRDTKIVGFQGISPKQVEFSAFGGYKGACWGLVASAYDTAYGNVSSSAPETDLNAMHLQAEAALDKS